MISLTRDQCALITQKCDVLLPRDSIFFTGAIKPKDMMDFQSYLETSDDVLEMRNRVLTRIFNVCEQRNRDEDDQFLFNNYVEHILNVGGKYYFTTSDGSLFSNLSSVTLTSPILY